MKPTVHEFAERLNYSQSIELDVDLHARLLAAIPASTGIRDATKDEDRSGTDIWIDRAHGLPPVSVDFKNRDFCPIARWQSDDACIETTSVYQGPGKPWEDKYRRKPGWSIDEKKRTDLIVHTWPAEGERRRFWILYFPILCTAARKYWREWAEKYGEREALNEGYRTLSVYPPRVVIAHAMRAFTDGGGTKSPSITESITHALTKGPGNQYEPATGGLWD